MTIHPKASGLPEFSGELSYCDACSYPDATVRYVGPPLAIGIDQSRRFVTGEWYPRDPFLLRTCVQCDFEWGEQLAPPLCATCSGRKNIWAAGSTSITPCPDCQPDVCNRCQGSGIDPEDSDIDVNAFAQCRYCSGPSDSPTCPAIRCERCQDTGTDLRDPSLTVKPCPDCEAGL